MDRKIAPKGRSVAAVVRGDAAGVETERGAGVESVNVAAAETNGGVAAETVAAAERGGAVTETITNTVGGQRARVQ